MGKGFPVFQYSSAAQDGSGFGSWKKVPAVPVPFSVSGTTVPTVPVSGSRSVLEPLPKADTDQMSTLAVACLSSRMAIMGELWREFFWRRPREE